MIRSFKCRETAKIFNYEISLKLPQTIQERAVRKLYWIDSAKDIRDLRIPPSNHLKLLQGNKKGKYSIRINNQWRICFEWLEGNAYDLEIIDYH